MTGGIDIRAPGPGMVWLVASRPDKLNAFSACMPVDLPVAPGRKGGDACLDARTPRFRGVA